MMVYVRSKKRKGKTYYYIVEGKLVEGKVKQKVIMYLGTIAKIISMAQFYKGHHPKL